MNGHRHSGHGDQIAECTGVTPLSRLADSGHHETAIGTKDLECVAKYIAKIVAKSVANLNVFPPASFFSNLPTASRKSPYNTFACALYL